MEKITYRSDAFRREHCLKNGIDPAKHCCLDMAWFISKPIEWDSQDANPVIMWINSWDEYCIEISHAGNAATRIFFARGVAHGCHNQNRPSGMNVSTLWGLTILARKTSPWSSPPTNGGDMGPNNSSMDFPRKHHPSAV
jgi:hypothetical protein